MARTSFSRVFIARRLNTPRRLDLLRLVIAFALVLLIPACSSRTHAPTAPGDRDGSRLAQRAGSSLTLSVQDGIVVDGLLIVWRAAVPGTEGEIEQYYDLTTIHEVHGFHISRFSAGRFGGSLLDSLRADPRIRSAEPNFVADTPEMLGHSWAFDDGVLDGAGYEDQDAGSRLGLAAAHEATRGAGILVAVLDTGVNEENPLLTGHVVPGWDFVDDEQDATETPDDYDSDADGLVDEALGHGTHVAGIVALTAPDARILPVRVLDNDGRGSLVAIVRGIDYAVSRGARVLNLSFGTLAESDLLQTAIDDAIAQGVVVVASAGNWGAEQPVEYPANADHVLAVAATDSLDAPASFTSYGAFVRVCAPGAGVRSSYWNGNTALWSGTSMSAGFASGGAALLLSIHPEWTWSDVAARLSTTAVPLAATDGTYASLTAGRMSLSAAVSVVTVMPSGDGTGISAPPDSTGDTAPPPPDSTGSGTAPPPDSTATGNPAPSDSTTAGTPPPSGAS